jgi:hypothetical protein
LTARQLLNGGSRTASFNMNTRICKICKVEKILAEFPSRVYGSGKIGPRTICKSCNNKIHREYWAAYKQNQEHVRQIRRKSADKTREQLNAKRRIKYQNDHCYRMRMLISASIWQKLKKGNNHKHCSVWLKLPYSPQQLKEHLEKQFESWMSWDNYGKPSAYKRTWNIDHIMPQSVFPYNSMDEPNFLKCWALENLRPLDALENAVKRDKIIV